MHTLRNPYHHQNQILKSLKICKNKLFYQFSRFQSDRQLDQIQNLSKFQITYNWIHDIKSIIYLDLKMELKVDISGEHIQLKDDISDGHISGGE